MTTEVEFDEAKHEYRVAGVLVPSVTKILGDLSMMKRLDPEMLADAAHRGRLVHMAVHYYNEDLLDESSVDPAIESYVRAWARFCRDYQYEPEINELVGYSEKWGYAGTPDTLGKWKQLRRRPRVLIDVKSGAADPVHGPQTAAYVEIAREAGLLEKHEMPQRAVVRLQANGFFQVDPMLDPADWSTFIAALTTYRFKERHGLL
jgi:hypothetical protein